MDRYMYNNNEHFKDEHSLGPDGANKANKISNSRNYWGWAEEKKATPDSKFRGGNMGPMWDRQDKGGPPCWPHELCYLGLFRLIQFKFADFGKPNIHMKVHNLRISMLYFDFKWFVGAKVFDCYRKIFLWMLLCPILVLQVCPWLTGGHRTRVAAVTLDNMAEDAVAASASLRQILTVSVRYCGPAFVSWLSILWETLTRNPELQWSGISPQFRLKVSRGDEGVGDVCFPGDEGVGRPWRGYRCVQMTVGPV